MCAYCNSLLESSGLRATTYAYDKCSVWLGLEKPLFKFRPEGDQLGRLQRVYERGPRTVDNVRSRPDPWTNNCKDDQEGDAYRAASVRPNPVVRIATSVHHCSGTEPGLPGTGYRTTRTVREIIIVYTSQLCVPDGSLFQNPHDFQLIDVGPRSGLIKRAKLGTQEIELQSYIFFKIQHIETRQIAKQAF